MFLATAPRGSVLGGEYYSEVNLELSSNAAHSKALAQQLWALSEELCAPFLQGS